jgi:hypothetical protein
VIYCLCLLIENPVTPKKFSNMMHKIALAVACLSAGVEGRRVQTQVSHLQASTPVHAGVQQAKISAASSPQSKYSAMHDNAQPFLLLGGLTILLVPLALWLLSLLFNSLDKMIEADRAEMVEADSTENTTDKMVEADRAEMVEADSTENTTDKAVETDSTENTTDAPQGSRAFLIMGGLMMLLASLALWVYTYKVAHGNAREFFVVGSLMTLLVPLALWLSSLLFQFLDKIALDDDAQAISGPTIPQEEVSTGK